MRNICRSAVPVVLVLFLVSAASGSPAELATQLEEEAHLNLVKGGPSSAISLYTIVLRLDPRRASAFHDCGEGYVEEQKFDLAIADFTSALKLNPKNAYLRAHRGEAHAGKGDLDRALVDFTEAIRLGYRANLERGDVYARKGELDKAIADFTEMIRLDPKSHDAFAHRRDAYLKQGAWGKAIEDYSAEIALHPQIYDVHDSPYWGRARAYLKQGDTNKAIADFKDAARNDSRFDKDGDYGWIGSGWWGSVPGYIAADYAELIRLDPALTQAYWRRGEAYVRDGEDFLRDRTSHARDDDFGKAIDDYTEVIRRDPKAYRALLRRGECFLAKEETDKAIADLTKVIEIKPEFFTKCRAAVAPWRRLSQTGPIGPSRGRLRSGDSTRCESKGTLLRWRGPLRPWKDLLCKGQAATSHRRVSQGATDGHVRRSGDSNLAKPWRRLPKAGRNAKSDRHVCGSHPARPCQSAS